MTLLKKLLPIASVASVAAVVAPLATSCGAGTKLDGTQIYIPTIAPAQPEKGKTYTNDDAANLYFEDLAKNPEIYAQDMKSAISLYLFEGKHQDQRNLEFGKFNATINYSNIEVDKTNHKLSFTLSGSADIVDAEGYMYIKVSSFNYKIKNLHYLCENVELYGWDFHPDFESEADDVEFTFKAKGSIATQMDVPVLGYGDYVWTFINKSITVNKDTKVEEIPYDEYVEFLINEGIFMRFFSSMDEPLHAFSYHMSLIPGSH